MLNKIKITILKFIYKLLIYKIVLLDKTNVVNINRLKEFSSLTVKTTHGDFTFRFLEDRRSRARKLHEKYVKVFTVEVEVPSGSNDILKELNNKLLMVIKIMFIKIDYKVIAEILFDLCLAEYIRYINKTSKA
jgi:hypothetical protein